MTNMRSSLWKKSLACAAIALILLAGNVPAWSAGAALRDGLRPLAKYVRDVVVLEKRLNTVAIGGFYPGIARQQGVLGITEGIQLELKLLLEKEFKLKVDQEKSELTANGSYAYVKDSNNPGLQAIKITVEVTDGNGSSLGVQESALIDLEKKEPPAAGAGGQAIKFVPPKKEVEISSTTFVGEATGLTGYLDGYGSQKDRHKQLDEYVENPSVFVAGTKIRSNQNSPYAIEILSKRQSSAVPTVARQPSVEKGAAFIQLDLGEVYEVVLYNDSSKEVAVALSIDGVDSFYFSEDRRPGGLEPYYHYWIVQPGAAQRIPGWHTSVSGANNFQEFLVTAVGQGAAAQIGIKDHSKVGVIHAQFSECWRAGSRPQGKGATRDFSDGLATGRGRNMNVPQQPKKDYEYDVPTDFITVRYHRPR